MTTVREAAAQAAVPCCSPARASLKKKIVAMACAAAVSALGLAGVGAAQQPQPAVAQGQQSTQSSAQAAQTKSTAKQSAKISKKSKKDRRLAHRAAHGVDHAPVVAELTQQTAQQTTPGTPAANQPSTLEEVTVTGSRIKRTNDFNTPTPTTVIDTATIESMGIVNVGQAALVAPANVPTFTPANTGNSNFFTGEYIADLRGLNPYFGSRTLLLVNGQRIVNSDQGDSFDMNLLPTILVTRIDTVTGGASAAYGSGAIAGVENVILDDKLEGGKLDGDFYETSHSDGRDRHIGAAYGHGLFDNKWHFVIGGEYENSDAVGCEDARSWCAANQGEYETGATPAGTDILGYGTNVRGNFSSTSGVLFPFSAFGGYHGGTPPVALNSLGNGTIPYDLGSPQVSFADDVQGGDGVPIYQYSSLQAPVNRGTGMFLVNGAITDYINFKGSVLLAREVTTDYDGAIGTLAGGITPQNAYACPGTPNGPVDVALFTPATCVNAASPSLASTINTDAASLIPIAPGFSIPAGSAYLNKDWTAQIPALTRFTTNVTRGTFGFDGKIGDSSWTWDANYEYGLTHHDQLVQDNYSLYRIDMALDSVIGPNGQPECRVTADGFAGAVAANPGGGYAGANPLLAVGCVPVDPFGTQPLSQAAINYAWGNLLEELRYEQTDANVNFSGNYFSGVGAGPWAAAIGYEWRQERGDNIDQPGEPAYLADDYETQYGSSFGGLMTVNEEYLETNIPLLKDKPGAHLLEFDLAARESAYSNNALYGVDVCTPGSAGCPATAAAPNEAFNHNFLTWKASGIYEPVDWFRLRGSQSRDERAPNFRELYYNQVIGAGGLFGQCGPFGTTVDPCTWNLLGNPDLKPESADTTTLGIVLTPRDWVPGFQFSADWFHIKVNNAIEQANPTLLETNCKLYAECTGITFNDTPVNAMGLPCGGGLQGQAAYALGCYNIAELAPTSYNGAFYEVKGVDFSLNYLLDLGRFGSLNTRVLTTWMDEQEFQSYPGGPIYSILGQTGTGNGFLNDYTPDARWRGSVLITWSQGPFSLTPNMTFVGHGVMDYLGVTPAQGSLYTETVDGTLPPALAAYGFHPMPYNYVPSYFLFGLNGTYTFEDMGALKGLQLFAQINNLLNKTPPFGGGESLFGPANIYGGTNPIFFDAMGLAYRVGFRVNF
ncbi:MAG TPA: TonB-dependent receptor [Steroidobacteraceae bacterium]|nr:TonB-dependent receptor [Steroidobacteraceae bacterium]